MNKLKRFWRDLRTSFFYVPSLIVMVSSLLAVALIEVDSIGSEHWLARWPRLFGGGAAGARLMLSTIAGSMMTVVGITFSMTLMTLMLASSQYTPRILRNFMRDTVTQVVIGMFAGIFTYCLIVLRTIRSGDEGDFVPSLAVLVGILLAMCGVVALILFIHHIASLIQASNIISSVAEETMLTIDFLFPEKPGQGPIDDDGNQALFPLSELNWHAVPAQRNGYIQGVDDAALLSFAREHKTIVRMEHGVGAYVVHGVALASLALERPPERELIAALQAAYSISRNRSLPQDTAFGIRQIVDMSLRALSPGINDTTTAVMCVDYLTAILARLAPRNIPASHRYEEGELRVIAIRQTFASLVAESFDQIRGSAIGNVGIMLRMLGALQTIGSLTASPSRRRTLLEQVECIAELAERTIESPHDRARCKSRLVSVRQALEKELVLFAEAQS
jgi:uncharacterized membrane protein